MKKIFIPIMLAVLCAGSVEAAEKNIIEGVLVKNETEMGGLKFRYKGTAGSSQYLTFNNPDQVLDTSPNFDFAVALVEDIQSKKYAQSDILNIDQEQMNNLFAHKMYIAIQTDNKNKKLLLKILPGAPKKIQPEQKQEAENFEARLAKLEKALLAANAKIASLEERVRELESKK